MLNWQNEKIRAVAADNRGSIELPVAKVAGNFRLVGHAAQSDPLQIQAGSILPNAQGERDGRREYQEASIGRGVKRSRLAAGKARAASRRLRSSESIGLRVDGYSPPPPPPSGNWPAPPLALITP